MKALLALAVAGLRSIDSVEGLQNGVVSRPDAIKLLGGSATAALATLNNPTITNAQTYPSSVIDSQYPGTAVERMLAVRSRVKSIDPKDWNGDWSTVVRKKLLWAGGLRDLTDARPGEGYTGHSFNDFNHVDLTCMSAGVRNNENDGSVKGIAIGNNLNDGIRIASLPELGPGGSWSTCSIGCNEKPPQDVAHVQFQSRIAFKLVWVPNKKYDEFVLVDDDGNELAMGKPTGRLPDERERMLNFEIMKGSKYSRVAEALARA